MSAPWINSELISMSYKGQEGVGINVKPFIVQIHVRQPNRSRREFWRLLCFL